MINNRPLLFAVLLVTSCVCCQSCAPLHQSNIDRYSPPGFLAKTVVLEEVGVEFVLIPGNVFVMGSEGTQSNETPIHNVKIDSFYMSLTEITQEQWAKVMGKNPSFHSGCDTCPVERITFAEANNYLFKASELSMMKLRLPTEAEWEYAANGSSKQQKFAGTNQKILLGQYAWYSSNSRGQTHPVGTRLPNLFGLFDMSGNVWEWCQDWYANDYYSKSDFENPTGPKSGTYRVIKGGSYNSNSYSTRTNRRVSGVIHTPDKTTGFRIAVDTY